MINPSVGTFTDSFIKRLTSRLAASAATPKLTCHLDSHADTCVAGRVFILLEEATRSIKVHPFSEEYKPLSADIGTAGTVWQDTNGNEHLLVFHEILFLGDRLQDSLLCPNQLRANGLEVDDTPRQFSQHSRHAIIVPDVITIPLEMDGIISGFYTRKPTSKDLQELPCITMTSNQPWHPHSSSFAKTEERFKDSDIEIKSLRKEDEISNTKCAYSNMTRVISAANTYHRAFNDDSALEDSDESLYERLVACIKVSTMDMNGDGIVDNDATLHPDAEQSRRLSALRTEGMTSIVTPQTIARRWNISLDKSAKTLQRTTQAGVRNVLVPSERKVRKKAPWLKFPNIKGKWYTDLAFSNVKSIHGDTGMSIFTNGYGYDTTYPWASKRQHPEALMDFIHKVGIPQTIVSDGGKEIHLGKTKEVCNEYRIRQKVTVPYSPWQNLAEASIREVKKDVRRKLRQTGAPLRTWSYVSKWVNAVRKFTASSIPALNEMTPYEHVHGSTPDISPMLLFDFWEPVYFMMPTNEFPHEKKVIGRWLGLAENSTDDMAFVILPETGIPITRKDVWAIPDDDMKTEPIMSRMKQYDDKIRARLSDKKDSDANFPPPPLLLFEDDTPEDDLRVNLDDDYPEADEFTPESMDEYLTAQVLLPHGGETARATVKARSRDMQGNPVGKRHPNPILDTRMYEVEFPDGSTESFTTNIIAENLFSQVDDCGNEFRVIKDIVDHRKDKTAVTKNDPAYLNGIITCTTKGWSLSCEMADGTTEWIPLKDVKNSNPVELAEYAITAKIDDEPAFKWWTRNALRKRDRIIKKVKSRYWKRTHKYAVELPKSVDEAYAIDRATGTTFWADAIAKEMRNVSMAFKFLDDDKMPPGYKHIDCHMIFDVKSDLTRKARFVGGGHQTDPPKESVYSSVVSRDSVRIAFTIAALNGLDILAADVQNAYLNAPTKEKCYTTAGLEFGKENVGRPVMIVRALYGLKSSGARWRDHMADTLREAGFKSCLADPDVWMRPNVRPSDGFKYYEYVLCYVDDVLAVSHEPRKIMEFLQTRYTLKNNKVEEPTEYLGTEIRKHNISGDDTPKWGMSSDLYVKRAIADVETELNKVGQGLKKKVTTPFSTEYRPELDVTPELPARQASYFQGLIGVLRWIIELGRVDIMTPVSLLSRYLALPREGHLEAALHIFAYLKSHDRSLLVFDDTKPNFDEDRFRKADWSQFYPEAEDALPHNMPEPRGKPVTTTCFVDADHAGCRATRQSHTGILLFVQRAPIMWYSKRQSTVETSTFGSEFVAMKTAIEQVEALRYKLRMMGVPLEGATNTFCDNESVFKNATMPESTLKKKHNAIAYHRTREAQAAGIVRIAWEDGKTNLADLLTKILPGPRLRELAQRILW